MKSVFQPLVIAAWLSAAGCSHVDIRAPHNNQTAQKTSQITKSSLYGVWEVISCSSTDYIPSVDKLANHSKSTLNYKYCFNEQTAYPGLPPDSEYDSADGGGEYYIVGDNIMVIRTGVPNDIRAYSVEISNDRLILTDSRFRTTFRRIAKSWNGKAPIIKPKEIPIKF